MSFDADDIIHRWWDLRQEGQIREAERSIERNAQTTEAAVADLHAALERLALLTQAMWELSRERNGVTEAELVAKVHEIDLRDGKADGRIERAGPACAKCGKTNRPRRVKCFYCGTPLTPVSAFGAL
jgi:hypothetical protein